jgi:transposase-like protein
MIPNEFSEYFSARDTDQQHQIIDELLQMVMQHENLPETEDNVIIKCPHCRSNDVRGNGKLKAMHRYVCKECSKHFSQSTGKFWYALKKRQLLNKYMHCLVGGFSIRKCAEVTGISVQTSFDWRHKLLTSFKTVFPLSFQGIVEINDYAFQYSEKGKRHKDKSDRVPGEEQVKSLESNAPITVVATCDRSGREDLRVITKGNLGIEDLTSVLKGRLQNAELLVSQYHTNYISLGEKIKIEHKIFRTSVRQKKSEKIFHIKNINNMYNRLITFLSPFHGVATKYLQNYMNWFLLLEKIQDSTRKIATIARIALSTDRAWFDYKNKNINIFFRT